MRTKILLAVVGAAALVAQAIYVRREMDRIDFRNYSQLDWLVELEHRTQKLEAGSHR